MKRWKPAEWKSTSYRSLITTEGRGGRTKQRSKRLENEGYFIQPVEGERPSARNERWWIKSRQTSPADLSHACFDRPRSIIDIDTENSKLRYKLLWPLDRFSPTYRVIPYKQRRDNRIKRVLQRLHIYILGINLSVLALEISASSRVTRKILEKYSNLPSLPPFYFYFYFFSPLLRRRGRKHIRSSSTSIFHSRNPFIVREFPFVPDSFEMLIEPRSCRSNYPSRGKNRLKKREK